ncbi:PREDICTED: UPF0496 protein At3g28270-like [Camelina sativa]|uniref:UPF0496 protein At3g28270-like n=1 Tax=Camelina sativa TaxID=90675 RepID=A0ABM0YWW0_CAMSA|nr:PREDICTED: UPF0496 protein At3g28270-like [Camelina sativa]
MALSEETMSNYSENMSDYKSACEDHPALKAFDSSLQQRTIKAIDSLTTTVAETGTGYMSQHEIHMEVSKNLLEVTQDVANFILESEDNVWESEALKSLVKAYFENTVKILQIFDNIIDCVEKAEMGRLYIQEAVAQFDKESAVKNVGGKQKRYENILKELKKFKAMGDPFGGQVLTTQVKLIQKQQESLLQEVSEAKKNLDEEIKELAEECANAEKWKTLSSVIIGAVGVLVFIGSIALMLTGVGAPVGIALAIVVPPVLVSVWGGVYLHLNDRMNALNRQMEALKKLKEKMSSVEIGAERDEVDTQLALYSIRDKVKTLTEKLKEVGETVANHSKLILEARFHVLKKINGSGKYHHG